MLAPAELKYQRENTLAFIMANPTRLELIPRVRVKDGTGTRFVDQAPRESQQLRLIDQSTARNTIPGMVQTSDGRERLTDFILLGTHDAEIDLWDYWVDATGTLEVAQMFPWNQYEVRASVVRRA
jgi:hypothetical protein